VLEELNQEHPQSQANYACSSSSSPSRLKLPRGAKKNQTVIAASDHDDDNEDDDDNEEEALQQQQLRRQKRGHPLPSRKTR
jgi:hypothetical protein